MSIASNLGYPRIGPRRELKKALETYWSLGSSPEQLLMEAARIRKEGWLLQKQLGVAHIPSNDFSLYDHVLDTCAMVGAVPARYGSAADRVDLDTYFAMARGVTGGGNGTRPRREVPAMEMTKWLDTNYHYIVPEFERGQSFRLASTKAADEYHEAREAGVETRPVLLGPVSFLLLGKSKDASINPLGLLPGVLPVYEQVLASLAKAGAAWVQLDEPCLALDMDDAARQGLISAYARLRSAAGGVRLLVASYFEGLRGNLATAVRLPVDALHVDLVRAPGQLDELLAAAPASMSLSLGVVDGRNVWKTDLERALSQVERAAGRLGRDRVLVAPSCSLLHAPMDLDLETKLDAELRNWLAFAKQKLAEVVTVARAVDSGRAAVAAALESNRAAMQSRSSSSRIHDAQVKQRAGAVTAAMRGRKSAYPARRRVQQERLGLPKLPTTTIGSFPQTAEVRALRANLRSGKITAAQYDQAVKGEIERAVRFQEEIGLDVLVHGEFERNDMVEYFGEQLSGFFFTSGGWVQSYGSRYVKPPVIFGDVARRSPMTVAWSRHAQGLTSRPMKGMLTGPVTILQWSFVRDDQPRAETCTQIALAIRDEVTDLEAAGIRMVQIDEPALREGLPLRRGDWQAYLAWAVDCFRLSASGVADGTQIHTHMCYSEFNDIIESIAAMDADVISIECSRSQMELLSAFSRFRYPNEIGPGVYDIHSPRVPSRDEMEALLRKALEVLSPDQLWVNPDCGLKTRRWEEVRPALENLVAAARAVREGLLSRA